MTLPFDEAKQLREPEELDTLLHSYFASQMPQSWPQFNRTLEFPGSLSSAPARRRASGRYVLAASLLLLLAGQSLLSGLFAGFSAPRRDREKGWMEAAKPKIETKSAHSIKSNTTEPTK